MIDRVPYTFTHKSIIISYFTVFISVSRASVISFFFFLLLCLPSQTYKFIHIFSVELWAGKVIYVLLLIIFSIFGSLHFFAQQHFQLIFFCFFLLNGKNSCPHALDSIAIQIPSHEIFILYFILSFHCFRNSFILCSGFDCKSKKNWIRNFKVCILYSLVCVSVWTKKKENTIVQGYSPSMDFSGLIAFHSPSWDRNNLVPNFLFISYERRRALFGFSHFS